MTFAKYPVTGGGSGSGDVVGPSSSTNNAVVLWDGTTGKLVKNSSILSSAIVLTSGNQTVGGTKTFSSAVVINPATNQIVLGDTNTTTINSVAPSASRIYTIPDAGADTSFVMAAGTQTIGGAKTFSSAVTINPTTNQLVFGVTNTTTINSVAPAASRTYTIIDAGGAADFVMTAATQTIGGAKTFSSAVTINTASNQVVLSSGINQLTINSGTSAAGRTYSVPDVGASSSFVMTEGNQTLNGNKIFSSFITSSASSNQLALHSGINQLVINSGTSAAARTYTVPDAGTTANFVMTAGTQTIGGTLTLPATVTYTSAGSIVKSGAGALTLTNASAAGLTFSGAFTLTVPATGTANLIGTTQTISAIKTHSAAIAFSGGTAANLSIWAASNVLRQRGGTSGWAVDNSTGTTITATDAGLVGIGVSPTVKLHVNTAGNTSAGGICLQNGAAQQHFWYLSSNTNSRFEIGSAAGTWDWVNSNGTLMSIGSAGAVTLGPASAIGGSTFPGASIVGRTDGSAPAAGYVGQSVDGTQTTPTTFPTTATWGDGTSVTLTSGRWLLFAMLDSDNNGATGTSILMGISTTSGNSGSGLTFGDTLLATLFPTGVSDVSIVIPALVRNITASTTYYLKVRAEYSAGVPRYRCRLTAIRIA